MAYTAIPNSDVDADSPLDETLVTALRDNDDYLKARMVTATGHTHDQTGTDEGGPVVPAPDSVTNEMMYNHDAGTYLYHSNDAVVSDVSSGSYVKKKEIALSRGGEYRVEFDLKSTASGRGKIYRNGVALGTEQTDSTGSYVTKSEDLSGWSVGDTLELWLNDATAEVFARNLRLYVAVPENPTNTLGA